MFFRNVKTAAIVVVTGLAVATTAATIGWHKVDEARHQGLPRTTIAELDTIITNSLQNKLYAEAVKAICTRIGVEGEIQGNKAEEKITRLQAEIAKAPAEMKPILEAVLANWYWQYCQQNWYRFIDRTRTTQSPSGEFDTWDLPRLLRTIDDHFQKALAAEAILQATAITNYDVCTYAATPSMPDACRPTLWDFLAHDAIASYSADVRAGAQAEDAFVLQADSPVFGTTAEFLAWQIECTDDTSPTVKALRLFQALLRFHQHDAQRDAFLDNELLRLEFGARKAAGEGTVDYYKQALQRYAEAYASHPFAARARATWATLVQEEDQDAVTAHAIAAKGVADFPDSMGGTACQNLLKQLEAKELEVASEYVWNTSTQALAVTYRNIDQVYFRVVAADYEYRNHGSVRTRRIGHLVSQRPIKEWSCVLPTTTNYQQHTARIVPPRDLKPGYYYLLASHCPDFPLTNNNHVGAAEFWVSNLALLVRPRYGTGFVEGLVLDAQSGAPIPGAKVGGWVHDYIRYFAGLYSNDRWRTLAAVVTDSNGCFRVRSSNAEVLLTATYRGDKIAMESCANGSSRDKQTGPVGKTFLFTDRSLYRPGQMVHYKGVCVQIHPSKPGSTVRAGARITVVLRDDNNDEEVARQTHQANAYGSFDGCFVLPRNRVTGAMSITVDDGSHDDCRFQVEEYKRPSFRVELATPVVPVRLGAAVAVKGFATAYSGAAMAGATVRYRVYRTVCDKGKYVRQSRHGGRLLYSNDQVITQGVATTAADGAFTISFVAQPSRACKERNDATCQFVVSADVTDRTGETRSQVGRIIVGAAALRVTVAAEEWLTAGRPVSLKVKTTFLDGAPVATSGVVKIYRLIQPAQVTRAQEPLMLDEVSIFDHGRSARPDPGEPQITARSYHDGWSAGAEVEERSFTAGETGEARLDFRLAAGAYRAVVTSQDAFGQVVTTRLSLLVVDEAARQCALRVPDLVRAVSWTVAPGETFQALWGSGYDAARAFVEIEQDGRTLCAYWTPADRTQVPIRWPVTEAMRGGFTLHVTSVHDNRAYLTSRVVDVPWSNKVLNVRWEHFVSLLGPGKRESWTAVVSGTNATPAAVEMVATLYDASLDAMLPRHQRLDWSRPFGCWRQEYSYVQTRVANVLTRLKGGADTKADPYGWNYRTFLWSIICEPMQLPTSREPEDVVDDRSAGTKMMHWIKNLPYCLGISAMPYPLPKRYGCGEPVVDLANMIRIKMKQELLAPAKHGTSDTAGRPVGLDDVKLRRNFEETAFFFPNLLSDSNGVVRLEFTMPEALTEWKFMAFAHDRELRSGYLEDRAATTKALMVQPNPPRFVREGDTLEFTVKVGNLSATSQTGTVRLALADAQTGQDRSAALGLRTQDFVFDIPAQAAQTFAWRITIPDGCGFLTYRAVAASDRLSDGEEGYLPVLSRRIAVLESLPLPICGAQTKTFALSNLLQAGASPTLQHANLTVQMVSQPAWYAVMALPYLMEAPEERSDAVFNRLYANNVARFISQAEPKIRRVFDQWQNTPALASPLEQNQDLKTVALEETPWLREARDESQARRHVGVLFDAKRLDDEAKGGLDRLTNLQLSDGLWPWMPGFTGDEYITLYITTGFGRLRQLGVAELDLRPALRSLSVLDTWMNREYQRIKTMDDGSKEKHHLNAKIAFYLYGRSFFLKDRPVARRHQEALQYWLGEARAYWLQLPRLSQGHLAVGLKRFGDATTPVAIMKSIKEYSVSSEELGMFWRDTEESWWWYRAPIATQALMIEAFDEVMGDAPAVEACKVWLLKQKQTQNWQTSTATADAVYALLRRGRSLLTSDALVEVRLGGETITPQKVEAGTGYYEQKFAGGAIKPAMGAITVKKTDAGVSWGSVHWQYLEEIDKVTPHTGTPLKLKKTLYRKEATKQGEVLVPVQGPLAVGDELVSRIELRVDRDMEYVHLKDQRGSGTEPVNVLSQAKFQDGLMYYESTRDTASHFFIAYLPKGSYVFEYSVRVQLRGRYQSGLASIQCLYAPEFNSHSQSFELEVK